MRLHIELTPIKFPPEQPAVIAQKAAHGTALTREYPVEIARSVQIENDY
jgi:hypothetical protein